MNDSRRVLILDDEVLAAMALKAKLLAAGWDQVFIAGNYERACQLYDRESPDSAVIDINLQSEFSGLDFLRRAPDFRRVVILSGYGFRSYQAELQEIRYDALLEKPVAFAKVVEALG